jgi:hypothetical protein
VPTGRRRPAVADASRLLAAAGPDALGEVLAGAVTALACDDLVLRGPDLVQVLARSEPVVPRQVDRERWVLDAPVRVAGRMLGVLTAGGSAPFTAATAATLTAYADVIALALAAVPADDAVGAAGRAVLDEEAERAQLAASMDEGIGQALVTIRYAADQVAAGRADPAALDEPIRVALEAFRLAQRDLRAQALDDGLRAALRGLAVRSGGDRPADGQPALRVTVEARDAALDAVAPPVAVTVQRIAEAVLRSASGRVAVFATCDGRGVKLRVDSADIGCDASELDRWARRSRALGGRLDVRPDGVELRLPAQLPAREGPDDHRPDL